MSLITAMSLAGSIAMLLYYLAGLILRKSFGTWEKDILLKLAMFFFLCPIPPIKYELPREVQEFLQEFCYFYYTDNTDIGEVVRFGAFGYTAIPLGSRDYLVVESWKLVLAAVGVCAALGFIGYQTVRYFRLKRLLGVFAKDVSQETLDNNPKLRKLCKKKRIKIMKVSEIQTPFTLGVLRPSIFLSGQDFGQEELEFVLCHEAAHIKRRDVLVKWLGLLTVLVHWFNPLSYLMLREINKVSEYRCDEAVLRVAGDEKRGAYARLVVRTAAMGTQKTQLWATSLSGSKKDISDRVETIMGRRRTRRGLGIAVAVIAATLSSFGSAYAYKPEKTWINSDKPEEGEEVVFIPYTDDGGDTTGEVYFEVPDFSYIDFTRSDTVFIENATGNIIYLGEEAEEPEKYSVCKHKYQSGTLQKHIKNGKGGCAISVYKGKYCKSCEDKIYREFISFMKYAECTH